MVGSCELRVMISPLGKSKVSFRLTVEPSRGLFGSTPFLKTRRFRSNDKGFRAIAHFR